MGATDGIWSGEWVAARLGVELTGPAELRDLLGLALRRNPLRAHLLVSTVLGKHIPANPAAVYGAGLRLGRAVRELLGAADASRAVVLGYAETATGLGHSAADGLGAALCLHSTRRRVPGVRPAGGFEEEHSHATSHLVLPSSPEQLAGGGPLVLVDDEFSTGRTIRNTIASLHAEHPRQHYVVAALVDMRSPEDRRALEKFAADLGIRLDVIALATGAVELPADVLSRGQQLVAEAEATASESVGEAEATASESVGRRSAGRRNGWAQTDRSPSHRTGTGQPPAGQANRIDLHWPATLPDGGRHGFTPTHRAQLEKALPAMAKRLAGSLSGTEHRVLVLGTEELMYAPLRLAAALEAEPGSREVRFSTTTRSPVLPVDDPAYAIRTRLTFPAHDAAEGERYAYNVAPGSDPARRFDAIVVVTDADTPELHAGLLTELAPHTDRVHLAVLPSYTPLPEPLRGPHFGSYARDDVGWLLQDLSDVPLEAPVEEREEAVQHGGAHYAESLPVEYQPTAAYQALYRKALAGSADRIAQAVATVTETVLTERSPEPVLVSLARAGTPVGILMRRWARQAHGLDLPHYAVSIVRGRGIDPTALRWLARHHDPADVVFVDGWTGKGAIARELAQALTAHPGFDPRLAVLADPGACVDTYGTRDDFLIPSACLNSTVSGLISRTVLRADLTGPGDFHGAKFYRDLAKADVSPAFIAAVAERFPTAARPMQAADRTPTWAGWAAVRRISEAYGIHDVNLVKPGVGETTRVMLRRVPWRVLARRGAGADLDHVRLLAEQRGVPVEEADDLPYTCVGLIHPRYTRGATGADGRRAR